MNLSAIIGIFDSAKEILAAPLKPFARLCYEFVTAVSPSMAAVLFIAVLAAQALWVATLKREKPPKGAGGVFQDLRFWAISILLLQIAVYAILR